MSWLRPCQQITAKTLKNILLVLLFTGKPCARIIFDRDLWGRKHFSLFRDFSVHSFTAGQIFIRESLFVYYFEVNDYISEIISMAHGSPFLLGINGRAIAVYSLLRRTQTFIDHK